MVKILVEGDDDKKFILSLLNHLKKNSIINTKYSDFSNYILHFGGKSKLLNSKDKKYLKINTQVIEKKVKKILFVFDCDFEKDNDKCNGMEKSKECFKSLKKDLNWDIKIDYYIFDRNLDHFLLETIKDGDCFNYFNKLIGCLDIEKIKPNKKLIADMYRNLYPYPQFDFSSDKFELLKNKLEDLFDE